MDHADADDDFKKCSFFPELKKNINFNVNDIKQ